MPYRTFVDEIGVPWEVWDVRPQWADRRVSGERRKLSVDDERADPPVLEQRRGADRRQAGSDTHRRVKLANGFSGGWLIFESGAERRRLSPIPSDWESAPTEKLSELCSRAVAPRVRNSQAD